MTHNVKYNIHSYRGDDLTPVTDGLFWWIQGNLKHGGIESQLSKVVKLVTLMTNDFLIRNPSQVGNVADILDCSGMDHVIEEDIE